MYITYIYIYNIYIYIYIYICRVCRAVFGIPQLDNLDISATTVATFATAFNGLQNIFFAMSNYSC